MGVRGNVQQIKRLHGRRRSDAADPSNIVSGFRHASKRVLGRYPAPYLALAARRHPQSALHRDTDVVIEGFGRSAVTFAVTAFQVAQNAHVHVAHHAHALAPILAASSRGVPVLVTIREPEATVLSGVMREPNVSAGQFLRSYVDFYERLGELANRVVLARFESVTTDFGKVIRSLNERFGTSFVEFDHSAESSALVFDLIEERASRPPWQRLLGDFLCGNVSFDEYILATEQPRRSRPSPSVPERLVQRPSAAHESMKADARGRYEAPSLERWRARAEAGYSKVLDAAV